KPGGRGECGLAAVDGYAPAGCDSNGALPVGTGSGRRSQKKAKCWGGKQIFGIANGDACQLVSSFTSQRSGACGIARGTSGAGISSRRARRNCGRVRAVANFRRVVAGPLGTGRVGCGGSFFSECTKK